MAYRIVYNAGGPVTFKELCDRMPKNYQATAAADYREYLAKQNLPAPGDKWSAAEKAEVWRWWMQRLCYSLINTKRFSVDRKPGDPPLNRAAPDYWERVTYLPGVAPKVAVVKQTTKLVDWSPDADKYARRYGKGTAFTRAAKKVLDGTDKPTPTELHRILEDGIEALAID